MLISLGIITALATLCALTAIWGRRQYYWAQTYRESLDRTRIRLQRTEAGMRSWRDEALRLRAIVDRIEN